MELSTGLAAIIARQWGLVSTGQLAAEGMTAGRQEWLVPTRWRMVLPGVVYTQRGPLGEAQRTMASLLYGGPDSYVVGASAARRYGIESATENDVVRIAIPRDVRRANVAWVRVTRPTVPDGGVRLRSGLRCASPARAVVTSARAARGAATAAIVLESVQKGVATVDQLLCENLALARQGSLTTRLAIEAAALAAWSVPEFNLYDLLSVSPLLPELWLNPTLMTNDGRRLVTPDGWYDDVGMAIMVHSRRHHAYGDRLERTFADDSSLVSVGVPVLQLTPRDIRDSPDNVRALVERAYLTHRQRPRPDVVAVRRRRFSA